MPRIRRAWDEFVPVRHLQRELMTEHRALAKDVFLTAYGDGSKTVCNYSSRAFPYAGSSVRPKGYILIGPDGTKKLFVFDKERGICEK